MSIYNDVIENLKSGKPNNTIQRFKVISGNLHVFQNGQWEERTCLPQWTDLANGTWLVSL